MSGTSFYQLGTFIGAEIKSAKSYADTQATAAKNDAISALRAGVADAGNDLAKLYALIQGIQDVIGSDDTTLDTVQEIVAYIKSNKSLIDGVTTNKVDKSSIYDGLDSTDATKVLSAAQGKVLSDAIATEATARSTADTSLSNRLDVVEGDATTTGSIAKALADAKAYADSLDEAMDGRVDALEEAVGAATGNLEDLTTTAKDDLVQAINEVDSNTDAVAGRVTTLEAATSTYALKSEVGTYADFTTAYAAAIA